MLAEVFTFRGMDEAFRCGILEGAGRGTVALGAGIRRWIDLQVVNWLGDQTGRGVRGAGSGLRVFQTGRIQQYMLMALLAVPCVQ